MTVTAPITPDLSDTPCSVAECLDRAHVMGRATVRIDPRSDAPPDDEVVTFGLPLCANHAHLLREGCLLTDFSSGL